MKSVLGKYKLFCAIRKTAPSEIDTFLVTTEKNNVGGVLKVDFYRIVLHVFNLKNFQSQSDHNVV